MSSIDKKAFGISDSLINAVNEALKGGQVKIDKNHNGKIDGQDFKMLRKEEVVDEGNPANKEKKNAAAASVGAKNRDGQYLSKMNPSVADKIRGREKMSGNDRQQHEEVVDEGNPANKEKKNAAAAAVGAKNKDSQYLTRINPSVADKIRGREKMSGNDRQQHEEVEQVDELSGSLAHRAAHGAWIKTDKAKAAFKGQAKAAAQARKFGQYAAKKGYYDAPKKTNEETQQVDEISTKLALNYAKGASKSMDTAAAKGSDGHSTFMKRVAGHKLALDKTNPEHKRLKAKVGTTDANAKDAAYKKSIGEDIEQVDELSRKTKNSYIRKADAQVTLTDLGYGKRHGGLNRNVDDKDYARKYNNRKAGIKKANEETQQVDELSTDTYHSAAQKAAKRAMGDVQGRSGPIFKKYAGMANKFRDKGMSQEKKEKAMKEETDPGFVAEADNAVAKQIAAKKDAFKTQLQQKIAAKQMNTMQAKANKRLSSINASNDKCTCQEGKGKSMTCEMHGDKDKAMQGGKEQIIVNPPMREAAELPKKVVTKGHEIAKSIIKNRAGVDNPYAVGMAQAKKSAKMNAYRTDRDKNKED